MGGGDDDGPVNPFVLPEDDGDTFKAIGLSLGKSIAVLFCLTAAAASTFQAAEVDREMNAARKARVTADRLKRFYNISDGDFSDLGDALSVTAMVPFAYLATMASGRATAGSVRHRTSEYRMRILGLSTSKYVAALANSRDSPSWPGAGFEMT